MIVFKITIDSTENRLLSLAWEADGVAKTAGEAAIAEAITLSIKSLAEVVTDHQNKASAFEKGAGLGPTQMGGGRN